MRLSAANASFLTLNCTPFASMLPSSKVVGTEKVFGIWDKETLGVPMVPGMNAEGPTISSKVLRLSSVACFVSCSVCRGDIGGCKGWLCEARRAHLFIKIAFIAESLLRLLSFSVSRRNDSRPIRCWIKFWFFPTLAHRFRLVFWEHVWNAEVSAFCKHNVHYGWREPIDLYSVQCAALENFLYAERFRIW